MRRIFGYLSLFVIAILLGCFATKTIYPTPPAPRKPASVQKLPSIVRLSEGDHTFCTGTVINKNIIITAAHCVLIDMGFGYAPREAIEIRAEDNIKRGHTANVLYASTQMDQAVLVGDFKDFEVRPAMVIPDELTQVRNTEGIEFIACGYPLMGPLYCSKLTFKHPIDFMWAVSGVLLPGMSGGPVMLLDGTVVAINSAVYQEISIVTPIYNLVRPNSVKKFK